MEMVWRRGDDTGNMEIIWRCHGDDMEIIWRCGDDTGNMEMIWR